MNRLENPNHRFFEKALWYPEEQRRSFRGRSPRLFRTFLVIFSWFLFRCVERLKPVAID